MKNRRRSARRLITELETQRVERALLLLVLVVVIGERYDEVNEGIGVGLGGLVFIRGDIDGEAEQLRILMESDGGEPIGSVLAFQAESGTPTVSALPLPEYCEDERVLRYLSKLAADCKFTRFMPRQQKIH